MPGSNRHLKEGNNNNTSKRMGIRRYHNTVSEAIAWNNSNSVEHNAPILVCSHDLIWSLEFTGMLVLQYQCEFQSILEHRQFRS
eukprot:m.1399344 g.1399344  ORF g.1399344 m.1399344 type:complete len:84 (-) comp25001_c1_seq13:609-860(-)